MVTYNHYEHSVPEIVLNIPGILRLENKNILKLRFEIDYNLLTKEQLELIKTENEVEFVLATKCITYNGKKDYKMENLTYIPIEDENFQKKYLPIKTENNSINFKLIKKEIEIYKDNNLVTKTELNHSKNISISLADGTYQLKCNVYNTKDQLVCTSNSTLVLTTNYYQLNDDKSKFAKIIFSPEEGDFELRLSTSSKKLYSFKIMDIHSENDNIFEFNFFNTENNKEVTRGKIGADFYLLNDKQIDEIIKNPEQEKLIKPKFVFDIHELMTTKHSKDDVGVIRFPTIKSKIKDTGSRYYNLKCNVFQNYTVDLNKTTDFLITDKFDKNPLFYKFLITDKFEDLKIIDDDNNEIKEYLTETIFGNIKEIYFNPLRNKNYYYSIDNSPFILIDFKKSYESYSAIYKKTNKIEFDTPVYFSDLMIRGNEENIDIEITFADYNKKTINMKAVNKEFLFLEDERLKINKEILSLEIKSKKTDFDIINMICRLKNNRMNYSFFKTNHKDFVYIANEISEINIDKIPETEIHKLNINKKYVFKGNEIIEVSNGPLYLEEIYKQDVIFTDIDEYYKEFYGKESEVVRTGIKDNFFQENVINPDRRVIYED